MHIPMLIGILCFAGVGLIGGCDNFKNKACAGVIGMIMLGAGIGLGAHHLRHLFPLF
jgi:hypothetical protein